MKKQTAIEWLEEKLNKYNNLLMIKEWQIIIEQAKEMEKQQIEDAHNDGHNYYAEEGIDAKQYYNKTFSK